MRWPRRALFGCAALKSAHPTSRQTVSAEVAEIKPKSDLAVVFLDRIAVDTSKERARRVRLDGDHLVGPVVELAEQNAIELDLRNVCRRKGCDRGLEPLGSEVQRESR